MAVVGQAVLELQGDANPLRRSLNQAQAHLNGFSRTGTRSFNLLAKAAGTFIGTISAAAITVGAKRLFEYGAAVEETASKFRTTLGPETERAQKFLDGFARTAGLTSREGQDLIANLAGIAQGMGLTQAASADLAEQATKLAGDLASFNNIPIEETSRAVIGGFTGERESLKRLGIVLLETEVQKRALANTGKAQVEQLTQEEKALASLELMYQKAGVQVGDLERTKTSAANRAKQLAARFREIRDTIAQALLPALSVILDEMEKLAGGRGVQRFTQALQENGDRIAAWTRFAVSSIATVAQAVETLAKIWVNNFQIMGESALFFSQIVRLQFREAAETFKSSIGNIRQNIAAIGELRDSYVRMMNAAGLAWETAKDGPEEAAGAGAPRLPLITPEAGGTDELSDKIKEIGDDLQAAIRTAGLMESTLAEAFDLPREGANAYGQAVAALADENVDLDRVITAQGATFRDLIGTYQQLETGIRQTESAENALSIRRGQRLSLDKEAKSLLESLRTDQQVYNEAVARTNFLFAAGFLSAEQFAFAIGRLKEEFEASTEKISSTQRALQDIVLSGFEAIGAAATGAGVSIKQFVASAIQDLARLAVKLLAVKALMALFPGSGFVSGLGKAVGLIPGLAHGGPAQANHPFIVGERGPELFVPRNSGMVVPNHALAGGGGISAAQVASAFDISRMPAARHRMDAGRDEEWVSFLRVGMDTLLDSGWRMDK